MDDALQALLNDPVLRDVSHDCTLQELQALHARAVGDVLTLRLVRLNQERTDVVVPIGSRVCDLKKEIQRVISTAEEPTLGGRHISWKYVWKMWALVCGDQELRDPRMLLSSVGVTNGSEITFRALTRMRSRRAAGGNGSAERRRHAHYDNTKRRIPTAQPHHTMRR